MRITRSKRNAQQGNMIIVCVMFSVVLGITIASYLIMVHSLYISSSRSGDWNTAMTLAEAGVEDALALVNKHVGDFANLKNWPATAVTADHWEADGNVYHARRTPDAAMGYYDVWITNLDNAVSIYAEGTATGNVTDPAQNGENVRKLLVQAGLEPLFTMAAVAANNIDLNYNRVSVDSFDPTDPLHSNWSSNSTFGIYDSNKRKDDGTMGVNGSIVDIGTSNLKIYGYVQTGLGGISNIQQNVSVGDLTWNQSGIQPDHGSDDMNAYWPPVRLPVSDSEFNSLPTGTSTNIISINQSGYYKIDGDVLRNSLTVSPNVTNAVLYLTQGLDYDTFYNPQLSVPTNSSLTIYAAKQFVVDRNSAIFSTNAGNLFIYGLSNLTSIRLESDVNFTGCIYAPQSDLIIGDHPWWSYGLIQMIGSFVTKSISCNGTVIFSYPEDLLRTGSGPGGNIPARGFVVTNWTEL